jgi:hypothetical protein
MRGSASKSKTRHSAHGRYGQRGCLTLSHLSLPGGTAKVCADWAFVSGVSPVSPNLKLIDRTQNKKGRGSISCRPTPSAETARTSAKVSGISAETTGPRHT